MGVLQVRVVKPIVTDVRAPGRVRLKVVDVQGRLVKTLLDGSIGPGPQSVSWDGRLADGRSVSPGVYFWRLETVGGAKAGKLTRLR